MPIRINLLAEAQALEDLRRRDPVKRAIWVAFLVVAGVLIWSTILQGKIIVDGSSVSGLEGRLSSKTNRYNEILASRKKLGELTAKLTALNQFTTNRYLHGPMLDAFQHATVDGMQLIRLRSEQAFDVMPAVAGTTGEGGKPGRPGSSTERIKLLLDLKDTSDNPGRDLINRFEDTLAQTPYIECSHISTNNMLLKNLSAPTVGPNSDKQFVQIYLECLYPDRVRRQ